MCGITFSLCPYLSSLGSAIASPSALHTSLAESNSSRGPDSSNTHRAMINLNGTKQLELQLTSSVLGLRGSLTAQPIVGETGVLAWNGQVFDGLDVNKGENDTRVIFEQLESGVSFEDVLSRIEGPYACVWYSRNDQTISFQVDPLSRRSLLLALPTPTSPILALSSTRSAYERENGTEMRALLGGEGGTVYLDRVTVDEQGAMNIDQALEMRPYLPGPSTYLTRQTRVHPINTTLPPSDSIPSETFARDEVEHFERELLAAVKSRIENIPAPEPGNARVAVLFSGGVDCTLLASMMHQCLPANEPVELVNVAFQRLPSDQSAAVSGRTEIATEYDTPDRLSGYEALTELGKACEGREWRFVEVNVTYEEYHEHRQRIVDLMYPATTEMDLSLAYPLYFASRGIGTLDGVPYTVKSKVYISGLGADEQLGGYARHRHAYTSLSFPGLLSSLQTDISQLPTRNTSRDDRLLSSFARDARYPYLSLAFIRYLSEVPIWHKVHYESGEGWGDKILLRMAAERAGLEGTARRVKRAMQFGSRSAKVGGGVKGKAAGTRKIE
ncbi:putative cytoplasm protein [Dioszegia hungarica]|uniref:Cytoplasm protein n=1 Tax=Dioszegia hungarica TaxID=4972 RepID=A0AA38LUP3_9TREE|nr:putative cytoplasm protein [Dioszegia hungarica]KAI9635713.1 putative cytoplasm protein [Dioszegia hungarica]